MKRTITLLLCIITLASCGQQESRFVIDGTIIGAKDGELLSLAYPVKRGEVWYKHYDSTYVHGGRFRFEGAVPDLTPATLCFENQDATEIYLEPTHISFEAERNRVWDNRLSGLSIDDELSAYRVMFNDIDSARYHTYNALQTLNRECVAASQAENDDANALWQRFYTIVAEYKSITSDWPQVALRFVEEHADHAIVPYVAMQLVEYGYEPMSLNCRQGTLYELFMMRCKVSKTCGGKVGSRALDFELEEAAGGSVRLSECYARGYVLLDFWASWCRPCLAEIPKVEALYERYGDKLQILSISVDDDVDKWRSALSEHRLNRWPQLILPSTDEDYYFREQGNIPLSYGAESIPCFVLVDPEGNIVGRWSHLSENMELEALTEVE